MWCEREHLSGSHSVWTCVVKVFLCKPYITEIQEIKMTQILTYWDVIGLSLLLLLAGYVPAHRPQKPVLLNCCFDWNLELGLG